MCIIAIKPANSKISAARLFNMWVNNPHGAGLMFANNGQLKVFKGLMNFGDLMNVYLDNQDKKMVIHFRWRTHGPVSRKLTHPFWITDDVAMVHNGIIPDLPAAKGESDTSLYTKILRRRYNNPMKSLRRESTRKFIVQEIGFSKLIFMNSNGMIDMINGHAGHFSDDDCWYSNHSYTNPAKYDKVYSNIDYNPKYWNHSTDLITI